MVDRSKKTKEQGGGKGSGSQSLEELQQKSNKWRSSRQKQGLIPKELWEGAVKAVEENPSGGVSRVGANLWRSVLRLSTKRLP